MLNLKMFNLNQAVSSQVTKPLRLVLQNSKLIKYSRAITSRDSSSNSSSSGSGSTYHTATHAEPIISSEGEKKISSSSISKSDIPGITDISLSQTVPYIAKPIYSGESESSAATRVTKLDNGITVASEPKFGSFCTVGVVLDSGSRYEVAHPSGISHFLEKLAFGDTLNLKRHHIMQTFESYGGICDCQTLRDAVIYAASIETDGLEKVIEVLSEVIWRPQISEEEFEMARMSVSYDLENLSLKPEKDAILMEMIHKAAFRDNTLGLPKICPPENVGVLQSSHILSYLRHHHTPERMVVAGVGVDHDTLVNAVDKFFKSGTSVWEQQPHRLHPQTTQSGVDASLAQYTGGICKEEVDLSNVSLGPDPLPELVHLVLGLESVNHQHEDFVACCVLNVLMGGGGSFSAGGPGKGMYTRLYTNVLNRQHWMHNAVAFNHAYLDAGLFCILASSHPSHLHNLTQVLTQEMVSMASDIKPDEVERAKTQLRSMLMMNLESRPVIFEDLARQVLSTSRRHQPLYFANLIRSVTLDDIHRVAANMLKSKVSVAAYGSLSNLPKLDDIQTALHSQNGKLKSKSGIPFFR